MTLYDLYLRGIKSRVRIKVRARVEGFGLRVFLVTSDSESNEKMRGHSVTLT